MALADTSDDSAPGVAPAVLLRFSRWERLKIALIAWFGALAVALIGGSLRWETFGRENYEAARRLGKAVVLSLWHCQIFPATWYWRRRGIVVMASQNFDGEYTARALQFHGYGTARGSSSRQGSRALVELIRVVRQGRDGALTVDGPRGPRFVAKPGIVQLAQHSGAPIFCFHIASRRPWILRRSWDRTEIPKPFSRAATFMAPPILVPANADPAEQSRKLAEVQAALDELVRRGEEWKANG